MDGWSMNEGKEGMCNGVGLYSGRRENRSQRGRGNFDMKLKIMISFSLYWGFAVVGSKIASSIIICFNHGWNERLPISFETILNRTTY